MKFSADNLALGTFLDTPEWKLEAGVMTDSLNVRYRDGAAEKIKGYSQVLGDLSATANYITMLTDGATVFYVYANLGDIYGTDGTTHTKISTISYSATADLAYNGGFFHGYLVFTEGVLDPQSWDPGLANKVAGLDGTGGWPASTKCEVIRPFRDFLVALRIDEGSGFNRRLIRWSESSLAGNLPTTWDYTDPQNDSGRTELGQTYDNLVDCLPLRNANIVYKQQHTWAMEHVGGSNVFNFRQIFSQVGMLTENCAKPFKNMHFVVTDHDVVVHDGNGAESVLERKARRWLFNRIDSDNYKRSYVVADYRNREMIFCYPEPGQDFPEQALVWNWQENNVYPRALGNPMAAAITGLLPAASATTFDGATETFASIAREFDEQQANASKQYVIFGRGDGLKAYQDDDTEQFDGVGMSTYLERSHLPLVGDISLFKRVLSVFPHVDGTAGDTFEVRIGTRNSFDAAVSWSSYKTFTIGTDYKLDFRLSARLFDIRFRYTGSNAWRIFGYDIEFNPEGYR